MIYSDQRVRISLRAAIQFLIIIKNDGYNLWARSVMGGLVLWLMFARLTIHKILVSGRHVDAQIKKGPEIT